WIDYRLQCAKCRGLLPLQPCQAREGMERIDLGGLWMICGQVVAARRSRVTPRDRRPQQPTICPEKNLGTRHATNGDPVDCIKNISICRAKGVRRVDQQCPPVFRIDLGYTRLLDGCGCGNRVLGAESSALI